MSHLATEALLDLAEGTRAESEAARLHLASCGACRDRLADVRAAMAAVLEPVDRDVPEPSPLFWEHFSTRVQAAIASDAAPHRTGGLERWLSWQMLVPAAACLVAFLAAAATLRMSVPSAPAAVVASRPAATGTTTPGGGTAADSLAPATPMTVDAAPWNSWSLMTDLAGDLDWEAAVEAGLTTPAGGVDRALFDLSADERRELQRLLRDELSRSGA